MSDIGIKVHWVACKIEISVKIKVWLVDAWILCCRFISVLCSILWIYFVLFMCVYCVTWFYKFYPCIADSFVFSLSLILWCTTYLSPNGMVPLRPSEKVLGQALATGNISFLMSGLCLISFYSLSFWHFSSSSIS